MNLLRNLGWRTLKRKMSGLPCTAPTEDEFKMQRVLLVSKTTRLEMEKLGRTDVIDADLRSILIERGSDFLVKSHDEHKRFEKEVMRSLERLDVQVKLVNRYDKQTEFIDWADIVMSVGGDGTYLMAANNVSSRTKPVVGLNSCPATSIGYLCLPKMYSADVFKTLSEIKKRRFTWAYRQRIKVTLQGRDLNMSEISVHDKITKRPKYSISDPETPLMDAPTYWTGERDLNRALFDQVFIAEGAPSSVSYLDIAVDDGDFITTKSSGICICTGSGSSSWNFTMNRISREIVQKLFTLSGHAAGNVDEIVEKYNNSLRYAPGMETMDDERMDYTIRDMIPTSMWPKMPNLPAKGFARKIQVRSQCREGYLVIDGGCAYHFNSGTTAILRTDPESILKTITLNNHCNL